MRKPTISYKKLTPKSLFTPQYSHLLYLFGWLGYFAMYFLTENFIPRENCYPVHCFLDDIIPFCEVFVIPYVLWYLLIVFSLLYFALYNADSFKKLMTFIIVTQVVAMAVYIIFPNRQDLRPETFPRDNIFTDILGLLYSFDTSTNVCPSLHVAYSVGIASAFLKERDASRALKAVITVFCLLVCVSVAFVKQHSVVDIFAAVPLCVLAEYIAYRKYWKQKFKKEG